PEDEVVEAHHRAAVAGPVNETAESLLQSQGRLGERQLRERVSYTLRASRIDGIGGHRKRESNHDHAAQALAGNIDPLPEARGPEQERALRLLERLEQLPALAVDALREDEHVVEVDALLERRVHITQ